MFRISSAFVISLVLHVTLLFLLFYLWSSFQSPRKNEQFTPIKVQNILLSKEISHKTVQKKEVLKKKRKKPKRVKKEPKKVQIKKKKKILKKKKELRQKELVEKVAAPLVPQEELKEPVKTEKVLNAPVKTETTEKIETSKTSLKKEYIQNNLHVIAQLIQENLYYPRSARKRNKESQEMVEFRLLKNATVLDVKVIDCKVNILCKAAIQTIQSLSGKFPRPNEELLLHVPINYTLKEKE